MIINVINIDPEIEHWSVSPNIKPETIKRCREERIISICRQSKEQKFACQFWPGVIAEFGGLGIMRAFKKIVQWAKDQGLEKVCIAEDDMVFSALGAWEYYLDNMPDDFDIYSGGIYSGGIREGRIVNGYSGNTLITVHEKFYDFLLSANEDRTKLGMGHLDRWLGCFATEKNYRVVNPFVVYQLQGYSDNHRRSTSHEGFLAGMKFFGS